MSTSRASASIGGWVAATLLALVIFLLAAALAEFATGPQFGHRINTSALPAEAQAVLSENSQAPLSAEQWRRLNTVMAKHGGWPGVEQSFVASVRHSWYWFICLPALGAVGLRTLRPRTGVLALLVVAAPSLLALVSSFLASAEALVLGAR